MGLSCVLDKNYIPPLTLENIFMMMNLFRKLNVISFDTLKCL